MVIEMMASAKTLAKFCLGLTAALLSSWVSASQDLDVEYAEHLPLVSHSMFLDITRVGDTLVAVGERGHIILSTDGNTWTQADIVPTRATLTSVYGINGRLWAAGHDAVIITSGDGGKTWTLQNFDPDRQQAVMDIYFSDDDNGVAIGSYGLFLSTSDGGQNWEDMPVDEDLDYHLNSLVDLGDGRWLIAGEAGYAYRSYDGGESWETIELPYPGSMWGAITTNGDCVLIFGLRGHIMESCDFGLNWTELESGTESSISGAAEFDGLLLFAANSGIVLLRDDGRQIDVYHHSSGVDFSAAISLGDGRFLLVGEDGVHHYPETAPVDSEASDND